MNSTSPTSHCGGSFTFLLRQLLEVELFSSGEDEAEGFKDQVIEQALAFMKALIKEPKTAHFHYDFAIPAPGTVLNSIHHKVYFGKPSNFN